MAPKRAKLDQANAEFTELQVQLAAKKFLLQGVQAKLAKLQEQLEEMNEKKRLLEAEVDNCEKVLNLVTIELRFTDLHLSRN